MNATKTSNAAKTHGLSLPPSPSGITPARFIWLYLVLIFSTVAMGGLEGSKGGKLIQRVLEMESGFSAEG